MRKLLQVPQHAPIVQWWRLANSHHHFDTRLLHVHSSSTLYLLSLSHGKRIGVVLWLQESSRQPLLD